jgi:hypothetical protein
MENRAAPRRAMWHRDSRSVQTSAVQPREATASASPPAARVGPLAAVPGVRGVVVNLNGVDGSQIFDQGQGPGTSDRCGRLAMSGVMLLDAIAGGALCEVVHISWLRAVGCFFGGWVLGFPCCCGVFGGVGVVFGWICGVGCGRVLFSESPPLKRKDSGQSPDKQPENGSPGGVPVLG